MEVKGKKIGFILTGSFCTFNKTISKMKELIKLGADIIPIMSYNNCNLDTNFRKECEIIDKIKEITKKDIICTMQEAELIGPKHLTDIMIIAPASGNTISKLACDIIDTPALIAVTSHLRNNLPVVIAPSSNSGLGANMVNIAKLINRKNYYFVPFKQNNPITKPMSIMFDPEYIVKTIEMALDKEQIEPILL